MRDAGIGRHDVQAVYCGSAYGARDQSVHRAPRSHGARRRCNRMPALRRHGSAMKAAPFTYHDPRTLGEALERLHSLEGASLLAGGQSLVTLMNFRIAAPAHLIDLNRVDELAYIRDEGAVIRVGAMTRQRELEFSPLIAARLPVVQEALGHVGYRQTRNRGTLGGSLCHLDPSAELVGVCALLDAVLHLRSASGARDVPIAAWGQGLMTNALAPGEMLVAVTITPWQGPHGHGFVEFARRHGDFAIVAVGAMLRLRPDGAIAGAALCLSGVAPVPVRAAAAERLLIGQRPGHAAWRAAAAEAARIEAMQDQHVSQAYRQHLARILSYRALELAAARALPQMR